MWRHLTPWTVLEFKGRNVRARVRDLDLLIELSLGVDRRLNEERARENQSLIPEADVSFWYIVNHFGKRFLREARQRLGGAAESEIQSSAVPQSK